MAKRTGSKQDPAVDIFKNIIMHSSLSNLVIHCADGRLMADIYEWLRNKDVVGHCDELSFAGGCKDLVSPQKESDRDYLLRQIGKLRELHGTQRIFLMNHTDCGAYGGAHAWQGEEEFAKHAADLKKAAEIIKSQWPDMEVQMVVLIMEGDRVKDFKKVKLSLPA